MRYFCGQSLAASHLPFNGVDAIRIAHLACVIFVEALVDGCAIAQGEPAFGDIGLIAALARRLGDAGVPAPATPLRVAR